MRKQKACDALNQCKCLELRYDGFHRIVEVHAVGDTAEGNGIMRVWQIRGGSRSNDNTGWKLLRLDEAGSARITAERSNAPRRGYTHGDQAMEKIYCQIEPNVSSAQ